jgi:hypothetical protein
MDYLNVPRHNTGLFKTPVGPDLALNIHYDIYGDAENPGIGAYIVWQKLVRDVDLNPIKSPYVYKNTLEGMKNGHPSTTRTGFLCNEFLIRAIVRPSGRLIMDDLGSAPALFENNRVVFITSPQDPVRQGDVFLVLEVDDNGEPIKPLKSFKEFILTVSYPKYLHNGKIMFYTIIAEVQK